MEVSWSSQSELSEELTSSKDEPEAESELEPAEKGVESLTLSNIKVGIVLVGEVSLESPDGGHLVIVADGHKFVRVGPAACGLSDDLAKLGELLSDLTERFRVQVQKGDAANTKNYFGFVRSVSSPVQAVHITVNVPGSCRRQEQIPPEQFRHLRQGETVETVEAVLCSLLLPEPDKNVALLFPESPSNANHFAKLGEIVPHFLLRNFSVFVQKAETEVTKNILLHVPVELDQSVLR